MARPSANPILRLQSKGNSLIPPARSPAISQLESRNKLRLLPLIGATYFMVSGGPYGLEDIIGMAGFGRALLLLAIVPILWSLPTALMVGELASAIPDEGGFYIWVKRAMGRFWGFQEAWLSLAASIFDMAIYPTTFTLYLGRVFPAATAGHRGFALKLAIVLIATLWNLRGARAVGEGSVYMMLVSLSPFIILIAISFWKILHGGLHLTGPGIVAHDMGTALSVTLWNYMGWDNASTIAQEVDNPQRNYPRAMFASALLVAAVYMIPVATMWALGIPASRFSTGAWADAASLVAGGWLAFTVVAAGSLDGLGTFNALTLTLTRLPYAMAEDGLLPSILKHRTVKGVPWVSVILCAICWALALTLPFERLISIDLVLYGGALVLEFVALIILRRTEPTLDRPFRVPGHNRNTILIAIGPTVLLGFAMYAARDERVAGINALLFAAIVATAGALIYAAANAFHRRPSHAA